MDQPNDQETTRDILIDFSNALEDVGQSGESITGQDEQRLNELGNALAGRIRPDIMVGLGEEYRDVRRKANQGFWDPDPEMVDNLHFYPWLNEVSPQTEFLYEYWSETRELPEALLEQVPQGEIRIAVAGLADSVRDVSQKVPAAALGLLDKLIDFVDAAWQTLKKEFSSAVFGEIIADIRDALAAVARAVKATEFALQIGTTGVQYQFNFVVDLQEAGIVQFEPLQ